MSKRKPRRKPIGKPLPKAKDEDAEITPEDIEAAKAWAREYGTARYNAMLEATPAGDEDFE